ncbi:1-deoxy-D-xylulose 5-phosphate reductoisomerase [Caldanaerobius fijiensis DSM 17918]|uniref:1-deoxy-D-xylulose 5-phosphate reductoisomerase n=1 Tax=Caldanaerobius fijiensis DSM 17918 TaxID=1121256 RepID=A0A1M4XIJ1_9THEO|nr:1-deoxy-D-xylulose-5-phosphate reductoisomerase [Caldanaerobius fijiensis]SHE93374.1 1-deoxy-D-xylulose 5-phosphate reductoisomerase [Caldanaerobius fijiensis DSM 17918]
MKRILLLGSTGSIGTQALDVIRKHPDLFKVVGLAAYSNGELLARQANEFRPSMIALTKGIHDLKDMVKYPCEVITGEDAAVRLVESCDADIVLNAIVGVAGLLPTISTIKGGTTLALANKESMVTAGEIIVNLTREKGVDILPVDSEHSAIFQCLQKKGAQKEIRKIILTASGGPFRDYSCDMLKDVTAEQALKHPTWSMGKKITVDSATLMNKGFEVIEAHWFFGVKYRDIEVVIHPESIVHSMVEFVDGAVLAQMGVPDMRLPIQYALSYPERIEGLTERLNLYGLSLTFREPDTRTFRCLKLAYDAAIAGGTYPAVLNAANEICVELFLKGMIKFLDIPLLIEKALDGHKPIYNPTIEDIIYVDSQTRDAVKKMVVN